MAGTFSLDAYTCSSPPNTLWRVTHSGSQSWTDPGTGDIFASDNTRMLSNMTNLKRAAEDHFEWGSQQKSCFLSAFSCEEHAFNWAKQRRKGAGDVIIYNIETTKLPPYTRVFDALRLANELGITHKPSPNELVFLHSIPGVSITRARSVAEVEYGDDEVRPEIPYIPITGPESFDEVTVKVCPALRTAPRQGSQTSTGNHSWKRALSFSNDEGRTKVIRVDNVYVLQKIPKKDGGVPKKHGGKRGGLYGADFVTLSIPAHVRDSVAAAIRDIYPDCKVDDERFEPNEGRWFKAISNVEGILSVVTRNPNPGEDPLLTSFDVRKVLGKVEHAVEIRADLEIAVRAQASAVGGAGSQGVIGDTGTGSKTVKVAAVRGLVTDLDTGEVDMPRFARGTEESVLKRLAEIKIDV